MNEIIWNHDSNFLIESKSERHDIVLKTSIITIAKSLRITTKHWQKQNKKFKIQNKFMNDYIIIKTFNRLNSNFNIYFAIVNNDVRKNHKF